MRFHRSVAVLVLCALLLGACGNDTEGGGDATEPGATEAPAEQEENRVEVGMTEYAFGMPATITGGTVTLDFENKGELPHEAAFGSIGDKTIDDVMKAIESNKQPKWFEDLAGVPVLDPGMSASMTRDLDPGNYIFLCFLPIPGKGAPHVTEGMVQVFEAEGDSEAPSPAPDATITATDDGFDVPEIGAGEQTIELVNGGEKPHEFAIFSFEEGMSAKDIGKWFNSGFESEKPAVFPGGLQSIQPGTSVIVEMTFESGRTYTIEDFENKLEATFEVE